MTTAKPDGRVQPVNPVPSPLMMLLTVVILDGIKGGVGKSWLARLIAHFFATRRIDFAGVDGDPCNGHLSRFHPSQTIHTDATTDEAFDVVLDMLASQSHKNLLIDLPAGAGARLDLQMPALRSVCAGGDIRIVRIFVMEPTFDSINQFAATRLIFEPRDTLVVLNNRSGHDTFELWKASKTRAEFLKSGGEEACIGRLDAKIVSFFEVNPSGGKLNFADALERTDLPGSIRHRLTPYLFEAMNELERAFHAMELIR